MINALQIAATGMKAQQLGVDVISNNISNLQTTAFKRQRPAFQDLAYQNLEAVGATSSNTGTISPVGKQLGLGVNVGAIYSVNEIGAPNRTGRPFDMFIQGNGYFRVTRNDGTTGYTRDGAFELNENGDIVNSEGLLLDPGINIPPNATNVTISSDGVFSGKVDDTVVEFGTIDVTMFQNEGGLERIGENVYLETVASGAPTNVVPGEDGSGTILQSHLEGSNVDPIEEVTTLITAQRAYELNSRIISTADEMLAAVSQLR